MSADPIIELHNVRYGWKKDRDIVDVPELQVPDRARVFLYGPSGCGKSTLLGLLGGVFQPREGEVRLLGQNITALSGSKRDHFRADHIGFVFQMFNLVPYLSILDNVLLPCRFSKQRRERIHSRATSAEDEARRLLHHLGLGERLIHQPVTELSIGQQQRVAVARALIGSPGILIADEPTSALDTDSREAFLRLLFDECEREGITLVFVSHDQSLKPLFGTAMAFDTINRAAALV